MPERFQDTWYVVENSDEIPSPALLIYPDRIESNLRKMILIAGSAERLRPHVKTGKMGELIRLQTRYGIRKCKCATIAEAEMAAGNGAEDILLAFQPVGPQIGRFLALQRKFPQCSISTIADSEEAIRMLSKASLAAELETRLLLDIDNGMHRTGIAPGEEAFRLYQIIHRLPGLKAGGLHVYDGHIHESAPIRRAEICNAAYQPVQQLADDLHRAGLPIPTIVVGGTPTFPVHCGRSGVELSPGTTLLWDEGYRRLYPDLDFIPAALVLARIVGKPGKNRLCLDLGSKAIAAEMPHPRVRLYGLEDCSTISHSEEHLVIESAEADCWNLGDPVYGIPMHICPTVARYDSATVVRDKRAIQQWNIEAQKRKITI